MLTLARLSSLLILSTRVFEAPIAFLDRNINTCITVRQFRETLAALRNTDKFISTEFPLNWHGSLGHILKNINSVRQLLLVCTYDNDYCMSVREAGNRRLCTRLLCSQV